MLGAIEQRGALENISRFALVRDNELVAYKQATRPTKKSISTTKDSVSVVSNFKPRKRTNAYWQRRVEQRLTESERTSESYAKQVRKVYQEAQRQTVPEVRKMYEAYYKKDEASTCRLYALPPQAGISSVFKHKCGRLGYLPICQITTRVE